MKQLDFCVKPDNENHADEEAGGRAYEMAHRNVMFVLIFEMRNLLIPFRYGRLKIYGLHILAIRAVSRTQTSCLTIWTNQQPHLCSSVCLATILGLEGNRAERLHWRQIGDLQILQRCAYGFDPGHTMDREQLLKIFQGGWMKNSMVINYGLSDHNGKEPMY